MANSFKNNGKTITYTIKTVNTATYSDGTELVLDGTSVALTAVQKAYLAAKATEVPPVITPPATIPGKTITMGNVELQDLHDLSDVTILLEPGIYTDRCDFRNLKNVTIDGQNGVIFSTGQRSIQMNGNVSGLTLKNISFKDINDYVIDFWGNGAVKYTPGVVGSFVDGFTLKNVTADNCGTLFHADGSIIKGVHYGLVKNLVIDGAVFRNSPEPRSVVYLGNGMNYSISNCKVNNINYVSSVPSAPNGVHNGIFQLGGNGKFFGNTVTNHQGNAVRAWLHSHEGTQMVEIYNNIVWNSKKYGAFEIQATPDMVTNKAIPANASIHNNTAGHLNTAKDWEGQGVDVYNTGGTLEHFDNLYFEMFKVSGPITDGLNNMSDTKIIRNDGNVYYPLAAQAVVDTITFKSLIPGIGA